MKKASVCISFLLTTQVFSTWGRKHGLGDGEKGSTHWVVVAHDFNLRIQEAQVGRSFRGQPCLRASSRTASAAQRNRVSTSPSLPALPNVCLSMKSLQPEESEEAGGPHVKFPPVNYYFLLWCAFT